MNKFPESITHAYVMLTEKCPLRCKYCYISHYDNSEICKMEYIDKLIDRFTEKPTIVFFGGEPLLQLDLIKEIVKKYKGKCFFQLVTSGSINFIKFLKEVYIPNREDFLIQLSYDGTDSNSRIFVNSKPSEINIKEVLLEALKLNCSFETRTVISDSNIDTLYSTYNELKDIRSKFNKFYFDFNLAHQKQFSKDFYSKLYSQLNKIFYDIAAQLNTKVEVFVPNYFLQLFSKYMSKTFTKSCDIGNYVCMRPNGDLYPCTILSQIDEKFKIGNVLDEELDYDIFEQTSHISQCEKHCKFQYLCDGGCRYERIINYTNWQDKICRHTCEIQEVIDDCCIHFMHSLSWIGMTSLVKECKKWEQWFDTFHSDLKNAQTKRGI